MKWTSEPLSVFPLTRLRFIFSKIEAYVQMAKDQLHKKATGLYPAHLTVYAPKALTQYKRHMQRYWSWESSGSREKPMFQETE